MEADPKNRKEQIKMVTALVILFAVLQNLGAVGHAARWVWRVCLPVTIGFAIAFVLNVPMSFLEEGPLKALKKSPRRILARAARPIALALTGLGAAGLIALALLVVIPRLRDTVALLTDNLQGYVDQLVDWLARLAERFRFGQGQIQELGENLGDLTSAFLNYLQSEPAWLAGLARDVTSSVVDAASNLLLGAFIAIYVLFDKEKIGRVAARACDRLLPPRADGFIREMASLSYATFARFVRGQALEAAILGAACYLGMRIFALPQAAMASLIVGITALVPIAGAWVGGAAGAFLVLLASPIKALWFLLFFIALKQVETHFVYPRVVKEPMGLPGLVIVSAVIISGNIGGVVGMLIGVPAASIAYELIRRAAAEGLKWRKRREERP